MSKELETAQTLGKAGDVRLPASGKSKSAVLQEAGISTSAAHRAEQLADVPEETFEAVMADRAVRPTPNAVIARHKAKTAPANDAPPVPPTPGFVGRGVQWPSAVSWRR